MPIQTKHGVPARTNSDLIEAAGIVKYFIRSFHGGVTSVIQSGTGALITRGGDRLAKRVPSAPLLRLYQAFVWHRGAD